MRCYTGGNAIIMQLDRHPFRSAKVQKHVAFPEELDLQPWMHPESPDLAEDASLMYDLMSIIVHKGRAPLLATMWPSAALDQPKVFLHSKLPQFASGCCFLSHVQCSAALPIWCQHRGRLVCGLLVMNALDPRCTCQRHWLHALTASTSRWVLWVL